ncbi:hypothetical protein CS0771_70810 [Catellatospora sp. IY07-71]|nr:hypothetical protein CS0771_70810 [Catellatospora sp. IY07-71]
MAPGVQAYAEDLVQLHHVAVEAEPGRGQVEPPHPGPARPTSATDSSQCSSRFADQAARVRA